MVDQTELMSKGLRELLALLRFLTAVFDYGALNCMLWAMVWRQSLHLHGFWLVSLILENETAIVSESSWALLALIRFFTTVLDYGRSDGYCKQRLGGKVRAWMAFHPCGFDCGGSNCYCERRLGGIAFTLIAFHRCVLNCGWSDCHFEQRLGDTAHIYKVFTIVRSIMVDQIDTVSKG